MAELDAILTTDELLAETKAILDRNLKRLFNEAIYKREVTGQLKSRQDEIKKILKEKVIFRDDDEDKDN